jgi:plastocyanin
MYKHRFLIWPAIVLLAAAGLVGCRGAVVSVPTEALQPAVVSQVSAGIGNGTISGNIFAPREIVVSGGSTITWTLTSHEVHTVTFPP